MKNLRSKKFYFWIVMALVFVAVLAQSTFTAFAQDDLSSYDFNGNPTAESETNQVGIIAYLASYLLGALLSLFAYLLDWVIQFSNEIIYLPAIQNGWQIVLSFANLGFVMAIIVIAFATILRLENYAMKKILWKLIVAALLVNFSMVIAGAILSVSKIATDIFLQKMTADNFSASLAQSMNVSAWGEIDDVGLWTIITGDFSYLLKWFASLIFVIIFTFLTILAMAGLFVMFLIRSAALIFLLILSPLAWLAWILPYTEKHWKTWWEEFIRWNIFAPASLFFVYLAMEMSKNLKDPTILKSLSAVSSNKAKEALEQTLLLSSDFINYFAQLFVVLAILFGGLYVANKLGIAGGGLAYGWAQGAGKWAQGAAGKKGLQWGTSPFRRKYKKEGEMEAKSIADRVSEWSAKSKLAKYTILPGLAARGIAKFSAAGGENLVKDAKGAASKKSLNENIATLGYASAPERQGILQHLQEKDLLDKVPDAIKYIDKKYKTEATRFGQSVGYNNIEKSLAMNVEMKEAFNEFGKDSKQFREAGEKFFSKFSEKDWAKPQYNEIYSKDPSHGVDSNLHTARQEVFADSVAEVNPGQLAKIMSKIKGTNFHNYEEAANKAVARMYGINPEKAKQAAESFKKALSRRMLGIEWESTESTKSTETTELKEEKKFSDK